MSSNKSIIKWVLLFIGLVLVGILGLAVTLVLLAGYAFEGEVDNSITYGSNDGRTDVTPFVIYSKPRGTYTDAARENNTQGVVRLRVTLLSTGEVGDIEVVTTLPDGLTEAAVEAARQIKFTPKVVNGEPVSVKLAFEYGFNIE